MYTDLPSDNTSPRRSFNFEEFLFKYRFTLTFLIIGILSIGIGVLIIKSDFYKKTPAIEILDAAPENINASEIIVEISGAVEKPGVYKLKGGSRVEDLLITAGGISADADRVWINQFINRAAKLSDGQKIFIPTVNEQADVLSANNSGGTKVYQSGGGSSIEHPVNINTGSQKELEELPGIGPVYAQTIIEHRPYSTVDELLSREVLKKNVYEKIKDLVAVY